MNSLEINRRIAELEKIAAENKYRELLENLPQKIFHKDKNSVYVSCNNNYARDLKIQPDEIIGKTDYDFYTKELAEKYRADDKRIMKAGKTENIEEKYIQNGQEVFVQTVKTPLKDEKGNTIGILGIFWDITEARQIQEALKESEERYRTIIEYSNDMIWTLDTEGRFLFFNKCSEEITGFKLEEWRGKSFAPLIEKDDLTKVIEVFHKTIDGEPQQYEVTVKKADGSKLILLVNTAPIYSKGKVVGTVSFGRDITERKETEEQIKESLRQELEKSYENLRDSEARYRDLFENADDPMYTHDLEGRFLSINKVGLKTLGAYEEEVIGSDISKWLTPESYGLFRERVKKIHAGQPLQEPVVIEVVCKNGEHRWGEVRTRLIRNGDKITVHGIARDVTENMILKQELKKSNKQRKLLCYLIEGTRGGKTRALVLKHLGDRSYNAHQLAKAMDMDYKTIRHHLDVLIRNGIITKCNDGNYDLYFISNNIKSNLNEINRELLHNKSS